MTSNDYIIYTQIPIAKPDLLGITRNTTALGWNSETLEKIRWKKSEEHRIVHMINISRTDSFSEQNVQFVTCL